jgi:uracil-DNA glycosylase
VNAAHAEYESASARLLEPLDSLIDQVDSDWRPLLNDWRLSDPGRATISRVDERVRQGATVYPAAVFRALEMTPAADTRVVILGQDPYHGDGQANGLAFSVSRGKPIPPSLRNIFKEMQRDVFLGSPATGDLSHWAQQGVLLLNACLTVDAGKAGAHSAWGWQLLTDSIIGQLAADRRPKVFMLWGSWAQQKLRLIKDRGPEHLTLLCNHPSPLSAGRPPRPFFGACHFSQASKFMDERRGDVRNIDWRIHD